MTIHFFLNLICISLVVSLFILILKVCSPLFKSRYGAKVKQILWILLAIRLVIPFTFSDSSIMRFRITETEDSSVQVEVGVREYVKELSEGNLAYVKEDNYSVKSGEKYYSSMGEDGVAYAYPNDAPIYVYYEQEEETDVVQEERSLSMLLQGITLRLQETLSNVATYENAILIVYLSGAALFVLVHWISYLYMCVKRKKAVSKVDNEEHVQLMERIAREYQLAHTPDLYFTEGIKSPMVMGAFSPSVYLPCAKYSEQEMEAILRHELMHIRHKDLWIKKLYFVANAMHWFNPMCYLMTASANKDMELYCDADVLVGYDISQREQYNSVLVNLLERFQSSGIQGRYFTTHYRGGVEEMKQRFLNNLDMKKKKKGVIPIAAVVVLCVLVSTMISVQMQVLGNSTISTYDSTKDKFTIKWQTDEGSYAYEKEGEDLGDFYVRTGLYYPEDVQVVYDSQWFYMGDENLYIEPRPLEEGFYGVTVHREDGEGNIEAMELMFPTDGEALKAIPEIEIYCNNQEIEDYGMTINNWTSDDSNILQSPNFFVEQTAKGEGNPLFQVSDWTTYTSGEIALLFPEGMLPDAVDVEDFVLSEDGTPRYDGFPDEVVFRQAHMDVENSLVVFSLADHSSISLYETRFYDGLDISIDKPFYRGYKVRCYWVSEEGVQSVTYMFVIRTQNNKYAELYE